MNAARWIVVVLALLSCGAALADDDAKARAQALFKEGQASYQGGDYASALKSFEAAYDALPAPALYFNIAQCHRKLNDHKRAVEALQLFIDLAKNVPAKVLKEAKQQLAEEKKLYAKEEKARAKEEKEKAKLAAAQPPPPPVVEEAPPPPPPEPAPAPAAAPPPAPEPVPSETPIWANPIVIGAAVGTVLIAATAGTVAAISLAPGPTPPETTLGVVDLR
jgi:hypothetical protein